MDEQKPVGWFSYHETLSSWYEDNEGEPGAVPLYRDPPKRDLIPLDDEELLRCECDAEGDLSLMAKLILQRMMEKNP